MFKTLRRALAAFGLALGFAAAPVIAEAPAPATAQPMQAITATPTLWTITKPNGHTITLFGSVHILPKGSTWQTDAFTQAFGKADVVVLETPIDAMKTPELMSYLQQSMMNAPGVTLSTLLKPDEKAIVQKAADSAGVAFSALEPLRPWFVAVQLTVAFAIKQGFDPASGADMQIEANAKAAGKTMDYFETAREQLDIFITLPQPQEIAFLVLGSKETLEKPDELFALVNAWAKGDQATIDTVMNGSFDEMPDLGKKLLEDRNTRWVEKISGIYMNDDKNYFIAVGAGHLAGAKGVPALLRNKGITVAGP